MTGCIGSKAAFRKRLRSAMSRRSLLLPIPLQSSRSPRESPIACAVMHNLLYEIFSWFRPLAVAAGDR
jgi:hypothetical protein